MTGARLAGILRSERAKWNALLAQVGVEGMEIPGVVEEWSVKELVAHLTWYEQNTHIATRSRARPASEVLAEADAVFGQLLVLIEACPDDSLNDPRRLGLPNDLVPWMGVANNSYAHYREHEPALRAWLVQTNQSVLESYR